MHKISLPSWQLNCFIIKNVQLNNWKVMDGLEVKIVLRAKKRSRHCEGFIAPQVFSPKQAFDR